MKALLCWIQHWWKVLQKKKPWHLINNAPWSYYWCVSRALKDSKKPPCWRSCFNWWKFLHKMPQIATKWGRCCTKGHAWCILKEKKRKKKKVRIGAINSTLTAHASCLYISPTRLFFPTIIFDDIKKGCLITMPLGTWLTFSYIFPSLLVFLTVGENCRHFASKPNKTLTTECFFLWAIIQLFSNILSVTTDKHQIKLDWEVKWLCGKKSCKIRHGVWSREVTHFNPKGSKHLFTITCIYWSKSFKTRWAINSNNMCRKLV